MGKEIQSIKPTLVYRVLHKMKLLNDVQKHGQITFFGFIGFAIGTVVKRALFTYLYKGYFLEPLNKNRHLAFLRM
ncbi:hypothetical protein AB9N12_10445 [Bacteroides sp. AN502(2024)]|uniref:hypothetical protein n=1 Tax=Bacteroides sp. AN502(2024) TaxID=3160599 RepID=UPI003512B1CA